MSNLGTRTTSRWIMTGAGGLGVFGGSFAVRFARGDDSRASLILYGVMAALSLVALGIGLYRTSRVWPADRDA